MKTKMPVCLFLSVAGLLLLAGCRDTMPHSLTWPAGGDQIPSHPKPPEGGYYTNWDPYAATIEVEPVEDINPVGTQHIFIATVKDRDGKPLPNRRVEWMLSDGVGSIVEVDESGIRASRGYKADNRFAVSHTNNGDHVLTRGNDDPDDDVHLTKGQTWCVITSPIEGTSYVVAYAPGIHDWNKHKAFAKKHWYDVAWKFPPEATNPIGTPHRLTTVVTTHSDNKPLGGYEVTYKIISGPAATLKPGGGTVATVKTDAQGMATVTLEQVKPVEGVNEIQIDVVRPANVACCKPAVHVATGNTRKTWIGPKIGITKSAPANALVGQEFTYRIAVSNPSSVATRNTMLVDVLPEGIAYVSSDPRADVSGQKLTWKLGDLGPGATAQANVVVKATRTGTFRNCADVTADFGLAARACAETVVAQPKLEMTKTAPAEVLICEPIEYVVTVKNTGSAPATNVTLKDKLPKGLVYKQQYDSVNVNFGTIEAGGSKVTRYTVQATKTGTYTNAAGVTGDGGLSARAQARTVVRQPVLVITKTGPKSRYAGAKVTYTMTVTNKGDGEARNTVLTDTLPAKVSFVSASDGGKHARGKVTWNLGTLGPEKSAEVTVTVKATEIGEVENFAVVTATCAKASTKAITDIRGIPAILLECVDQADPIEIGAQETYTITVTNQGTAADTNIVIKCTLPAEEQFVKASGPTKEAAEGQTVTFTPLKSLAPKARATFKVVVKALKAGDVRFAVSLTSDQLKTPVSETEATNIYSNK